MNPIVSLEDVSLRYHSIGGETSAVSLSVQAGEFISIVGPSGCGKSTILSMLAGQLAPSEGSIYIGGTIGYMLQKDYLLQWRSIRSNALLGLEIQKKLTPENIAYVDTLLTQYGLGDFKNSLPNQLSGGMRQRAALIRTLAVRPDILLLDEPFSALDGYLKDVLQREMQDFLKDYPGDMILVTHSRDEAYKFCRELSIVHEGRILVTGETKQLFERPGLLEAAKLTGCKNFSRAERLGPHEIYAADWKMKLHTEENVDMDITHVGIRGHWIRPESEPGENCMAVQVDQYIETTFEHQYMIRNKAEENAAGLWWMRPKNSFTEDPDKDLPEYLYLPPEHLMLLK